MFGKPKSSESLENLTKVLGELVRLQAETNKTLKQLSHDNAQFLSTLTSFLIHEDQRKMRQEAKDYEQAQSKTPTKYDAIY